MKRAAKRGLPFLLFFFLGTIPLALTPFTLCAQDFSWLHDAPEKNPSSNSYKSMRYADGAYSENSAVDDYLSADRIRNAPLPYSESLPSSPVNFSENRQMQEGTFVKFNMHQITYSIHEEQNQSLRFNMYPGKNTGMLQWSISLDSFK